MLHQMPRPYVPNLVCQPALILHWQTARQDISFAPTKPPSIGQSDSAMQIKAYPMVISSTHWQSMFLNQHLSIPRPWKLDHSFCMSWDTVDLPARVDVPFLSPLFPLSSKHLIWNLLLGTKIYRALMWEWVPLVCMKSLLSRSSFCTPCLTVILPPTMFLQSYSHIKDNARTSQRAYLYEYTFCIPSTTLERMTLALLEKDGNEQTLLQYTICVHCKAFCYIVSLPLSTQSPRMQSYLRQSSQRHLETALDALDWLSLTIPPSLPLMQALLAGVSFFTIELVLQ